MKQRFQNVVVQIGQSTSISDQAILIPSGEQGPQLQFMQELDHISDSGGVTTRYVNLVNWRGFTR